MFVSTASEVTTRNINFGKELLSKREKSNYKKDVFQWKRKFHANE